MKKLMMFSLVAGILCLPANASPRPSNHSAGCCGRGCGEVCRTCVSIEREIALLEAVVRFIPERAPLYRIIQTRLQALYAERDLCCGPC